MTFYVQGLTAHDLMPLDSVFKKQRVEKTEAITAERAVAEKGDQDAPGNQRHQQHAAERYQSVGALPQADSVILAEQVMSTSVITLTTQSTVADALILFQENKIRHLPVVSPDGRLVGMVSERDVLHHLSSVTDSYQQQTPHTRNEPVTGVMTSPLLTASADTDVRYIARLFVEQRIGALPIVEHGELKGIIARSDVLRAVMRHFVLELWA